jgi:uncharacterized protein
VAKGSALNKLILVPAALAISYYAPKLIMPLLMIGGAFLCYEGAEKVLHKLFHSKSDDNKAHAAHVAANANEAVDLVAFEKTKIKGAIRTDFILSAEIIVIALGAVAAEPIAKQAAVLATVALLITVGVYGLVAAIVKFDDAGLAMLKSPSTAVQAMGRGILRFAPWLMKALSVVGTLAMFLVGGSILMHGLPLIEHAVTGAFANTSGFVKALGTTVTEGIVGLAIGAAIVGILHVFSKLRKKTA